MSYVAPSLSIPVVLGLDETGTTPPSYALILSAPYIEPTGNLLVLRTAPDTPPIAGTVGITEDQDQAAVEALSRLPISPVLSTVTIAERPDQAILSGESAVPAVVGEIAITADGDTAAFEGDGATLPLRHGSLALATAADVAVVDSVFTMRWVGEIPATEPADIGAAVGWFFPYIGPGFVETTEARDQASAQGIQIYPVAATVEGIEATDRGAIEVRAGLWLEETSEDSLQAVETATGEATATLVDIGWFSESVSISAANTPGYDVGLLAEDGVNALRLSGLAAETVVVSESSGAGYFGPAADEGLLVESHSAVLYSAQADQGVWRDTALSTLVITGLATDGFVAHETAAVVVEKTTAEVWIATDTEIAQCRVGGLAAEVLIGLESSTAGLALATGHADSPVLGEAATGGVQRVASPAEDALTAGETVALYLTPLAETDVGLVAESTTATLSVYLPVVMDTGIAAESTAVMLQLVGVLSDTLLAGDTLASAAQMIYVVNADTGAVSTYTLSPTVESLASYRGVLYLAGPEGLYAVDAAQDADGEVVWTMQTGLSLLGTDALKRVQDCNILSRQSNDVTLRVTTAHQGEKQTDVYRLPATTRDSYRDGVVKVGKGLSSVYWQFGLRGMGAAEIDQIKVSVNALSRRR